MTISQGLIFLLVGSLICLLGVVIKFLIYSAVCKNFSDYFEYEEFTNDLIGLIICILIIFCVVVGTIYG